MPSERVLESIFLLNCNMRSSAQNEDEETASIPRSLYSSNISRGYIFFFKEELN
jgi:hypothetical protein